MMNCQQFELYGAEASIASKTCALKDEGALQAFADTLRDTTYWVRNFPQVLGVEMRIVPERRDGSGASYDAEYHAGVCEMIPKHCNELIALHEIAHVLAAARYGSRSHDPWFARTYLELVSVALGSELYAALRDAFATAGVDFEAPGSTPGGIAL